MGIRHDLEGQGAEGLVLAGLAGHRLFLVAHLVAFDSLDVDGGRQEVDHRIEHGLDTLVLECCSGQNRGDGGSQGRATDAVLDLLFGELFAFEVLLHDRVVVFRQGLQQLLSPFVGLGLHVGGDLLDRVVLAHGRFSTPGEGAHAD